MVKPEDTGAQPACKINDEVNDVIASDSLLPAQFYPAMNGWRGVEGEIRLILAILVDAVQCFQRTADHAEGRQQRAEAAAWIFAEDHSWPFSFESICSVLGINSEVLRRSLRQWKGRADDGRHARPTFSRTHLMRYRPHSVTAPRSRPRAHRRPS